MVSPQLSPVLLNNFKSQCFICKKNTRLDFFKCKCNQDLIFCSVHRYPHAHVCSYDFRKTYREKLTRDIPLIIAEKLEKI